MVHVSITVFGQTASGYGRTISSAIVSALGKLYPKPIRVFAYECSFTFAVKNHMVSGLHPFVRTK